MIAEATDYVLPWRGDFSSFLPEYASWQWYSLLIKFPQMLEYSHLCIEIWDNCETFWTHVGRGQKEAVSQWDKMLVETDLRWNLPLETPLLLPGWVHVKAVYLNLPNVCFACFSLGHLIKDFPLKKEEKIEQSVQQVCLKQMKARMGRVVGLWWVRGRVGKANKLMALNWLVKVGLNK